MPSILNRIVYLVVFALLSIPLQAVAAESDYLSASLRQQVEELKKAYRAAPTTPATYGERAKVLWQWTNAYARTGRSIPVNMTTSIRPVLPNPPTRGNARSFDYFVEELILLDEEPNALGVLTADLGPFEARTFVTFQQRYRVGERPIKQDGGLVIARHHMTGYGLFQVDDPAGDNYLTIKSSNPNVIFVPDEVPLSGMHGGFRGSMPTRFFRVAAGVLQSGDIVTITYGDRSGGGRGLRMGSPSTDFMPVPVYIDFDGKHAYALPIQPIKVTGTDIDAVHGFAPSVVRPGEPFELSVRAQDRFYNRAKGPIPGFKVYANDELLATVPPSDHAISVIENLKFKTPGARQIKIVSADGKISGTGNPILVSETASKIYWGDTHGHSGFAEGIGTPDRFMQWAKEDARLDFVTHSEHDIWMDDFEWQVLTDKVKEYSEAGRFVGYLGYEWTTQNRFGGHHNVIFRDFESKIRIPTQLYPTLSNLYQGLRTHFDSNDVLVIPHAHQAGDYRQSDPELQKLVEIMSGHGTFEWFGRMYLKHGHQVGFIAASDNHLSQPGFTSPSGRYHSQRGGLAAVMAAENSRDGIFDALKSLKTYATTGDKIILDVRLNGAEMGQRIPFAEKRTIEGRVIGTAPIDSITIVKNDIEIWNKDYLTIDSGRYKAEETFYITFESESFPMHPADNPRGVRGWRGKLEITGAELLAFEATDFLHPEVSLLEIDPQNSNVLLFRTGTRGDTSSIKLRLANIKRSARIHIDLDPALEQGSPTRFRPHAVVPHAVVELAFKDLQRGQTRKTIPIDVYQDSVTLRRLIDTGATDVSFRFADVGNLQGDYYYVRVKQADDALAWSSPIWVGGIPAL